MSTWKYLLFYKPYGVLSQFTDQNSKPHSTSHSDPHSDPRCTLKDFIDVPGVYAAGRLDKDSEGLLLLTNHGWMQHRLCDPTFAHPRTYWVQVEGEPTLEAIHTLSSGVSIRGYRTQPAQVERLAQVPELPERNPPIRYRKQVPTAWLQMVLTEGKNRQVRRMTAAVGFPTLRLVRVAIGELTLKALQPGEWRALNQAERAQLQRLVKQ